MREPRDPNYQTSPRMAKPVQEARTAVDVNLATSTTTEVDLNQTEANEMNLDYQIPPNYSLQLPMPPPPLDETNEATEEAMIEYEVPPLKE